MKSESQQPEGVDGALELYRERLWPGFGISAFIFGMTASLGIAYGHAYGTLAGSLVGIISTVLVIGSLFINAPTVAVNELVIRAGKARLPLHYVGEVRTLDQSSTKSAIRENVHHQAYLLVRSWVRESVVITVDDETDPHPYWHISTRNAQALRVAIETARISYRSTNG